MRLGAATIVIFSCLATACGGEDRSERQDGEMATPAAAPADAPGAEPGSQGARHAPTAPSDTRTVIEPPPVMAGIPSTIAMPPDDAQTPPLAANARVTYVCESGLPIDVTFDGARAAVRLPDGREFLLTRAVSGAGEAEEYTGSDAALVRTANVIELTLSSEGKRMRCAESSSTA